MALDCHSSDVSCGECDLIFRSRVEVEAVTGMLTLIPADGIRLKKIIGLTVSNQDPVSYFELNARFVSSAFQCRFIWSHSRFSVIGQRLASHLARLGSMCWRSELCPRLHQGVHGPIRLPLQKSYWKSIPELLRLRQTTQRRPVWLQQRQH